ncbi:GNAT family N-acetyltransferase [Enterococcus sp. BWM-S5]|uniref:GNAT family N-acetyltransferase n=1 Tax=Enterococcus larvae TaxID=2794352 RepID=A0ABS4CNA1_9ENTE|nr:GNAT family N-acetyltransferase [Enterococcus larvae]MBP1047606.1 GNAT family N-acetyltransferase [Enterococcus larvae]
MIRKAVRDDIEMLIDMYNLATQRLLEKGIHQWDYPWQRKQLAELLPEFIVFEKESRIIGAMVLTEKVQFNEHPFEETVLFLEKLVIHPDFQRINMSDHLFEYARKISRVNGQEIYFDCWAGNEKLINYYSKRAEQVAILSEEDYEVALFRL